jgi:hypothetical protein
MNLADTMLPERTVAKLRQFNIREVEGLLSIVGSPTGLIAVSRVLGESVEAIQLMATRLRTEHPELAETPAAGGPFHPMGHYPPPK